MIFKNTHQVEIGYAEEIEATYMIFKKQVNEDDFIECHQYLIDMLNSNKFITGKHLVDTTNLKVITSHSRKWVAANVVPIMEKTATDKALIAVVLGHNAFTDFGAEHIDAKYNSSVHIHFFSQIGDAKMWLAPAFEQAAI